ncbi:hypothetical protein TL16_g08060 [Triparma laevis f. inornata]|uniref:Uncharacterized protein n=1 Tax=Triparma laevis f. inornata TaxID=1714386 RepID=A0A9W7AWL4_9STRA|nr:hypothetical protein TL16_g08060 [Triparma laevis f. inornata]
MASKFTSKGAKVYAVPEGEDGYDYNRGPTIIDLPKKYDYEQEGLVKEVKKKKIEYDGRILPVANSEGFAHAPPPSDLSGMINPALKLDDGHFTTFAQMELKRLMTEGKITNRPSLIKKDPRKNHNPNQNKQTKDSDSENDEYAADLTSATPKERAFISAVDTLKGVFPNIETSLSSSSSHKALLMQQMSRHAADRPSDVVFSADKFSAYISILGRTIADRNTEVSFLVLLDRLSTRNTPKELKQIVAKCLLALCKNESLDGVTITVPFLGSNKFKLQQRLFVLRLLTKEIGLSVQGSVLNCPLVMNVALDAIASQGEKVKKEGIALIVAAALSVGIERVKKYFRLKKIDSATSSFLESKILEGQAASIIKKGSRDKRRQDKKKMKKKFEGGGLDGVLEKAHEASFADNTTYIKSPVAANGETLDDDDLGF